MATYSAQTAQLQQQLNSQNAGKPGWVPLVVDGIMGPKTTAAQSFVATPSAPQSAQFNPTNGQPLYAGQTVTYNGITYTGTTPQPTTRASAPVQTSSTPTTPAAVSAPAPSTQTSTNPNTVQFNPNNGQQLQPGQAVTYNGQTYTQGQPIPTTTQTVTPPASTTPTTATTNPLTYDSKLVKYGITQDIWNQMSPTQQAVVSAATGAASALYGANASNVTLQSALQAAATDPTLIAKYADALKVDTNVFQQNLQQIQQATSTTAQQQQTQFENDRRNLSEQEAAAGQAYSGLRGRAQEQLGQSESGIISSSQSALQKQLNDATSAFESKYGTAATTPATAQFTNPGSSSSVSLSGLYNPTSPQTSTLSGTTIGGITGSNNTAKQADINTLAGQYVTAGQIPS